MPTQADSKLATIERLIAEQEAIFIRRQPKSAALAARARGVLAGGVTSNWQITQPQPVWLSHGKGSKVYDVDGNEYVDLHGGYGAALAGPRAPGHRRRGPRPGRARHPLRPADREGDRRWPRELARRFGLPPWRFANSGTEATMDAVHLMRSITGRDLIIKVEGCYHGHHDSVQVSVMPEPEDAGPADRPAQVPRSTGIPAAITDLTLVATFNDLDSVARLLDEHQGQVAGMIIEPIMMNAGIIKPEPGYLPGLKDLLHSRGALLTFDEVKTGLTVGPGGVTAQQGVTPTSSAWPSRSAAACRWPPSAAPRNSWSTSPTAATRWSAPSTATRWRWPRPGPCSPRSPPPEAYQRIERLRAAGRRTASSRRSPANGLTAHVVTAGAKGCVVFADRAGTRLPRLPRHRRLLSHAHWLYQHNGGVFLPPWGKIEQWLISVQHDEADIDRLVGNFAAFASAIHCLTSDCRQGLASRPARRV